MKINHYDDISRIEREAKRDYMAHAFCTKHGLWQSNEVAVEVAE